MLNILITGSSGFLAEEVMDYFKNKYFFIGIDREINTNKKRKNFSFHKCDINNQKKLENIFLKKKISYVFHFAAELLDEKDEKKTWDTNFYATKHLISLSEKYRVKKFIFTSTFSIFTKNYNYKIRENEKHSAFEPYGLSKLEAENYLLSHSYKKNIIIFRCPVIIGNNRLDKLGIMFDLININSNIWLIGNGENKVHYIYSKDIATAIHKSLKIRGPELFNIGSDNVLSTKKIFEKLLEAAKSKKTVRHFPKFMGLMALKILHFLKLVPFGPYHQKILVSNIVLNTSKIKKVLNWKPSITNHEMMINCYKNYNKSLKNKKFKNLSSSKKKVKLGIIKLIKFLP